MELVPLGVGELLPATPRVVEEDRLPNKLVLAGDADINDRVELEDMVDTWPKIELNGVTFDDVENDMMELGMLEDTAFDDDTTVLD